MKKTILFIMALTLLLPTLALAETKTIDVTTGDITIMVNGEKINITDSYGAAAEPFIYNGQVYVPLDNLADVLDKSYQWDGASMTAYLGVLPGEKQYLLDVCPPYEAKDVKQFTLSNGKSFSMANQSYTSGISMEVDAYALFNLNGAYESMTFKFGHVDGTTMKDGILSIFLDGDLVEKIELGAENLPKDVTIALNHALSMKFSLAVSNRSGCSGTWYGLGEVTLK